MMEEAFTMNTSNMTTAFMMTTSNMTTVLMEAATGEATPAWVGVFNNVQIAVTILGILVNLVTLITLILNGDGFADVISMLLKYQSALDAIVCLFGVLLFNMPTFWKLGNVAVDTIICQLWHGQYIYWASVLISIWNLVALAVERYICVCHPMKYILLTKKKMRLIITVCLVIGLIGPSGSILQVRMRGGQCYPEYFWDGEAMKKFFAFFAISTFFSFYAIPCALFFLFYGLVILSFRKRAQAALGASGTSSVIDKASSELTKTAVVVTIIFIVTYSFDNWYYLLAYTGFTEYKVNSPIQKISAFLAITNSVANPFVYASLMPAYRRSLAKTFKID